jgi:hypothetical protein
MRLEGGRTFRDAANIGRPDKCGVGLLVGENQVAEVTAEAIAVEVGTAHLVALLRRQGGRGDRVGLFAYRARQLGDAGGGCGTVAEVVGAGEPLNRAVV